MQKSCVPSATQGHSDLFGTVGIQSRGSELSNQPPFKGSYPKTNEQTQASYMVRSQR